MVIYRFCTNPSSGGGSGATIRSVAAPTSPAPAGRIVRLVTSPYLYTGWSALIFGSLIATWRVDPYLFALATLIAGVGTILVGIAGIVAQVKGALEIKMRMFIAAFVTVSGIIVLSALAVLTRFSWS